MYEESSKQYPTWNKPDTRKQNYLTKETSQDVCFKTNGKQLLTVKTRKFSKQWRDFYNSKNKN